MDPRAGYYGASPSPAGGGGYSSGGGGGGAASPSPSLDSVDMTPPASPATPTNNGGMRRRHAGQTHAYGGGTNNKGRHHPAGAGDDKYRKSSRAVRRLDMFPKVQEDYQVRTDRGGMVTLVGYGVALVLVLAEMANWSAERGRVVEHTFVDTR